MLSTDEMRAENIKTATSHITERMLMYELSQNVFQELLAKDNIAEMVRNLKDVIKGNTRDLRKNHGLYYQFTAMLDLLPRDEAKTIEIAIEKNNIDFIEGYFRAYFNRFLRLTHIDRKYKCTKMLFEDPLSYFDKVSKAPGDFVIRQTLDDNFIERYNLVLDFILEKEINPSKQALLYKHIVHSNGCDHVLQLAKHGSKEGHCDNMAPAMKECFRKRLCANTLIYNNIPENLDSNHLFPIERLDCKNTAVTNMYDANVAHLSKSVSQFSKNNIKRRPTPKSKSKTKRDSRDSHDSRNSQDSPDLSHKNKKTRK